MTGLNRWVAVAYCDVSGPAAIAAFVGDMDEDEARAWCEGFAAGAAKCDPDGECPYTLARLSPGSEPGVILPPHVIAELQALAILPKE